MECNKGTRGNIEKNPYFFTQILKWGRDDYLLSKNQICFIVQWVQLKDSPLYVL